MPLVRKVSKKGIVLSLGSLAVAAVAAVVVVVVVLLVVRSEGRPGNGIPRSEAIRVAWAVSSAEIRHNFEPGLNGTSRYVL